MILTQKKNIDILKKQNRLDSETRSCSPSPKGTKLYNASNIFQISSKQKIIFLDQFIFIKIMRAIDFSSQSIQSEEERKYWKDLYKVLKTLNQKEIIFCPWSTCREEELIVFDDANKIEDVIKEITKDIIFLSPNMLVCEQISQFIKIWISGGSTSEIIFKDQSIILKKEDEPIYRQLPSNTENDWKLLKENTRNSRNNIEEKAPHLFHSLKEKYINKKNKNIVYAHINDAFNSLIRDLKNVVQHRESFKNFINIEDINKEFLLKKVSGKDIYNTEAAFLYIHISQTISKLINLNDPITIHNKAIEFLNWDGFKEIPGYKINL